MSLQLEVSYAVRNLRHMDEATEQFLTDRNKRSRHVPPSLFSTGI